MPLRRSALSVCPWGDSRGTLLQSEICYSRAPYKDPEGANTKVPSAKVASVLSRWPGPAGFFTTTALATEKTRQRRAAAFICIASIGSGSLGVLGGGQQLGSKRCSRAEMAADRWGLLLVHDPGAAEMPDMRDGGETS